MARNDMAAVLAAATTLTACSLSDLNSHRYDAREEFSLSSQRYNFSGAATLTDPKFEQFTEERLAEIIFRLTPEKDSTYCGDCVHNFDSALGNFYQSYYKQNTEDKKPGSDIEEKKFKKDLDTRFYVARNEIQDIILTASEQRCSAYKKYLKEAQGNDELMFDALTTAFGGAGAIVGGPVGSRVLSGLAGISSGVGSATKQAIYANLTSNVIVPGIAKRRADMLQDILRKRCYSVSTYTLSLAIADAFRVHGACTMDMGIEEAGQSVQAAQNPGLNSVSDSLDKLTQIQQKVHTLLTQAHQAAPAPLDPKQTKSDQEKNDSSRMSTFEGITLPRDCNIYNENAFIEKQLALATANSERNITLAKNQITTDEEKTARVNKVVNGTKPQAFELSDYSKQELSFIVANLKENKDIGVEIVGYSSKAGAAEDNLTMSQKRAFAVADYIKASTSIDASRIRACGKGDIEQKGEYVNVSTMQATELGKKCGASANLSLPQ